MVRGPRAQLAVAVGATAIGVAVLWGSYFLPAGGGYAQVGPGVVPAIVGAVMIVLGIALVREALTGGFRGVDEEAELKLPMDWPAFAWVTGGIFAYALLVERLGFIIASIALFVLVARSFSSKRWVLNGVVGLLLASGIFAIFNYGLGLTLPAGILAPILP
jgi:putative tricarboxylic transport membrane protein